MDKEKRENSRRKERFRSLCFFGGGAAESRDLTQNHLSRSPAREWREFLERIARSCILRDDGEKGV